MCTITLYRNTDSYVFTMNRDERWERGESPPVSRVRDGVVLEYPVDSGAGGTWFGRNDRGVCIALLNNYQASVNPLAVTRGKIIPDALACGDFQRVVDYLQALDMHQFNAFDVVVAGPERTVHFRWDRLSLYQQSVPSSGWYFFTSSSVDFDLVDAYRRDFFAQWVETGSVDQVISGVHQWQTSNKSYSIRMERAHSHSKSVVQCRYPRSSNVVYQPL